MFATVDLSAICMVLMINISNNTGNYSIFMSTLPTFSPSRQQQQQQQQQQQYTNNNNKINKRQHK